MSVEQRAKLSLAQRAYVARDPRCPEHRRKLAAAEEVRRMTLFDNEVAAIVTLRRKGLNRAPSETRFQKSSRRALAPSAPPSA